jgi:hypothetical protein
MQRVSASLRPVVGVALRTRSSSTASVVRSVAARRSRAVLSATPFLPSTRPLTRRSASASARTLVTMTVRPTTPAIDVADRWPRTTAPLPAVHRPVYTLTNTLHSLSALSIPQQAHDRPSRSTRGQACYALCTSTPVPAVHRGDPRPSPTHPSVSPATPLPLQPRLRDVVTRWAMDGHRRLRPR